MLRLRPAPLVAALLASSLAYAQPAMPTVDEAFRARTIENLAAALDAHYVSRDDASKAIADVRAKNAAGAYDGATSPMAFADALSRDLQQSANDRHLRLRFDPGPAPSEVDEQEGPTPEQRAAMAARLAKRNYAFEKVEILDGNVGYLKFDGFMDVNADAYRAAECAMGFLANADALIFDLRENGGGSPRMVQFLCSYLFDGDEPVHLNSLYWRETDSLDQFWTLPHVPGERMPDVPVYVLTSRYTFSGAEEFCFNLQTRERATIVGETTGGGANPGGTRRIDTNFSAFIPGGRAVNPVTNTNWEGVGVKPDVDCPADGALDRAHGLAIETLRKAAADPDEARALEWVETSLRARTSPVALDSAALAKFAGTFGERRAWMEDGALRYQRADTPVRTLTPITPTLFAIEGVSMARVRFDVGPDGRATRLVVLYDNGREDVADRTE